MKKIDVVDEDGNEMQAPEPGSPVAQIIYLLEYGRLRGFTIGPRVQVGDTIVEVTDLRQRAALARDHSSAETDLPPGSDMAVLLAGDE